MNQKYLNDLNRWGDFFLSNFTIDTADGLKTALEVFTPTQRKIYDSIVKKEKLRHICILPTQYGKSLTVALAVITRVLVSGEKFLIVAPSEKKAKIIMGYVIDHLGDSKLFQSQLDDSSEAYARLKKERSKNRLTFKNGGEVSTLTLDSRNTKKSKEAAMGFGVGENGNVVLDESSLIDDELYSSVIRMVMGRNAMLFEIGNPFYRNHFFRTFNGDNDYNKLYIDYKVAMEEGRFSEKTIAQARGEALFDVYWECKFPNEDEIDDDGYRQLILSNEIKFWEFNITDWSRISLGCDIGGGGDYNVFVAREIHSKQAKVVHVNKSTNTMTNVFEINRLIDLGIKPENIHIDDIGIGRGVTDRLLELGYGVNGVEVGDSSAQKRYANKKAELYFELLNWIKDGGTLEEYKQDYKSVWDQLTWLKFNTNTDKCIIMEPKLRLKKRTSKSPDFAEALMLTFNYSPELKFEKW